MSGEATCQGRCAGATPAGKGGSGGGRGTSGPHGAVQRLYRFTRARGEYCVEALDEARANLAGDRPRELPKKVSIVGQVDAAAFALPAEVSAGGMAGVAPNGIAFCGICDIRQGNDQVRLPWTNGPALPSVLGVSQFAAFGYASGGMVMAGWMRAGPRIRPGFRRASRASGRTAGAGRRPGRGLRRPRPDFYQVSAHFVLAT